MIWADLAGIDTCTSTISMRKPPLCVREYYKTTDKELTVAQKDDKTVETTVSVVLLLYLRYLESGPLRHRSVIVACALILELEYSDTPSKTII